MLLLIIILLILALPGVIKDTKELAKVTKGARAGKAKDQFELGQNFETGFYNWHDSMKSPLKQYAGGTFIEPENGYRVGDNDYRKFYLEKARFWYQKAAAQKHAEAAYRLGRLLCRVDKHEEAHPFLKQAADQGHARARLELARLHIHGHVEERYPEDVLKLTLLAAQQGLDEAQYQLGKMHMTGTWVFRSDFREAAKWLGKAAAQGHDRALKDKLLADLMLAAEAGDMAKALEAIKRSGQINILKAISECCELADKAERPVARENLFEQLFALTLGRQLVFENPGFDTNGRLHYRASILRDPEACFELGRNHYHGLDTDRDPKAAADWYAKAAGLGHARAMFELGDCHYFGEGVPENEAEAVEWYQRAAELGNEEAGFALHALEIRKRGRVFDAGDYYHPLSMDISPGELARLEAKAKKGDRDSQLELGLRHHYGYSVPKNVDEAYKWLMKAKDALDIDDMNAFHAMLILGRHYSPFMNYRARLVGTARGCYKLIPTIDWIFDSVKAEAAYQLGMINAGNLRIGQPPEEDTGFYWFSQAAELGHRGAMYQLFLCYREGEEVTRDHSLARKWLRKAAEQGDVEALAALGTMRDSRPNNLHNLQLAAEQGHRLAQYELVSLLERAGEQEEARKWQRVIDYRKDDPEPGGSRQSRRVGPDTVWRALRSGGGADLPAEPSPDQIKWMRRKRPCPEPEAALVREFDRQNSLQSKMWQAAEAIYQKGLALDTRYEDESEMSEAIAAYRQAAELGHAGAMFRLGLLYFLGLGVKTDTYEADQLWKKAFQLGCREAELARWGMRSQLRSVGEYEMPAEAKPAWNPEDDDDYEDEADDAPGDDGLDFIPDLDWEAEIEDLDELLEQYNRDQFADPPVMDLKSPQIGDTSVQKVNTVCQLFQEAREGDPRAQRLVGEYYSAFSSGRLYGGDDFDEEDPEEHMILYETGDLLPELMRIHCLRTGGIRAAYQRALKWLGLAAIGGDLPARNKIFRLYLEGRYVDPDPHRAVRWLYLGKDLEDPQNCARIGDEFYNSEAPFRMPELTSRGQNAADDHFLITGRCYNPAVAALWYRRAAEGGDPYGQYALARCFYTGVGAEQHSEAALEWYQKSADQNFAPAMYMLYQMIIVGDGVKKSLSGAVKRLQQSADLGFGPAQYELAQRHESGKGAAKDPDLARKYHKLAATSGYRKAKRALRDMDSEE